MVVDGPLPPLPRAWRRPAEITPADVRWLAWHEARTHALISREVRDLGDGWLLYDATDREPFWNRLEGIAWPVDPVAFDRRLTEMLALFAGLDRIPHVWAFPGYDEPRDLVDRLLAFGFEDHGGGYLMALDHDRAAVDPARPAAIHPGRVAAVDGRSLTVERLHQLGGAAAEDAARAIAEVLMSSFEVEPERRVAIELEAVLGLATEPYHAVLVRLDGRPAAVARRTTFAGASYLSSIGTAPEFRGLGLGRLVTSLVVADAIADGSGWIYLGVFEENDVARRLYTSLGFAPIGGVAPDLLLRS
jgi:ribosomal protein S18 acetylase RimI-like enzyme